MQPWGINMQKDFHDLHFDSIQVLRGIAAILVVTEHIRFLNCGAFGVDIFFCISGFMIMFTTQKSTKNFLSKRLIRILPFYYLMTIGTYFLLVLFPGMFQQTSASASGLVKSLLFIPFDIGGGVLQPLLRIGWTINCEMFFYLLFAVCMKISHRFRGLWCAALLILITAAGSLFPNLPAPARFYSNPVMLEFALGILCYYAARELYSRFTRGKLPATVSRLSLLPAAALLLGLALTKTSVNVLGFRRMILWGLPAGIIVLCFFLAGLHLKMPGAFVKLGDISFSLYLVHYYPVLLIDRKICDFSAFTPVSLAGAVLTYALVIALAWAAWYFCEIKLTGVLKKKLRL